MARLSDLPLSERIFLRAYPFRKLDPVPWARPSRPLGASRIALLTTAGLHLPDQPPFDLSLRGGDPSFRIIPAPPPGTPLARLGLRIAQRSRAFDRSGVERDPNVALPLDRLHELEAAGEIGSVAPRHLSFMGSITAPGRLWKTTAPQAVALLLEDQVDGLVLAPV